MKCPYCKEIVDDDSLYCDQCGKEFYFCPECRVPKRGTECPVCGSTLIDGLSFFKPAATVQPQPVQPRPVQPQPARPVQPRPADIPQGTAVSPQSVKPSTLSGSGMQITLKAGPFGRTSGVYPEFSTSGYVSGRHGEFIETPDGWNVLDYGSTNGTFVNGVRIAPGVQTPLKRGDSLKIATLTFTVQ